MNRRDQIIEAVIEYFKTGDIKNDFSLTSIAKEVNIGKSTIYEYFSNKDELFKEAAQEYIVRIIGTIQLDVDYSVLSFEELFKMQMRTVFNAASGSRVLFETLRKHRSEQMTGPKPEMRQIMENLRSELEARFLLFFQKGIEEGIISSTNQEVEGLMVSSLVVGTIVTYSDPRNKFTTDEVVDALYTTVLKIMN